MFSSLATCSLPVLQLRIIILAKELLTRNQGFLNLLENILPNRACLSMMREISRQQKGIYLSTVNMNVCKYEGDWMGTMVPYGRSSSRVYLGSVHRDARRERLSGRAPERRSAPLPGRASGRPFVAPPPVTILQI